MERRLYRSEKNKELAGVCGGISEVYNIDISLVRLICVALCLFTGFGLVIYIAAALIIPSESDLSESDIVDAQDYKDL